MKALLKGLAPDSRAAWIIRGEDGELYAANIYKNQIFNAAELSEEEVKKLQKEVVNTNYEIILEGEKEND